MTPTPNLDREWLAAKRRANEAYEAKDAAGMIEAETAADLYSKKGVFVDVATRLANRLLAAAARVEEEPENHHALNSLGEVQSSGADVDRICGEIGTLRDVLKSVASAKKAAER